MKAHQSDKLKQILQDQAKSDVLRKKLTQTASTGRSAERDSGTGAIRVSVGHAKTDDRAVKKAGT